MGTWQRTSLLLPRRVRNTASGGRRRAQRGQTLVAVAVLATVLIGMLGLAVDIGYAYSERRQIQNAADAAALNGAREMDAQISNGNQPGADKQVLLAIKQYITAYNLTVNASGNVPASLQSAVYVNESGSTNYGTVGLIPGGQIPTGAAGVRVMVQEPWSPFLLGVLGFQNFTIAATATAASGTIPGADTVFVNCPPYSNGPSTDQFTISGSGGGNADTINGNVFVNGNVKANGGNIIVNGSLGASGTVIGNGINATGGISQNQPTQQFPLPDVAFPMTTGGTVNSTLENAGGGAYTPPAAYPEFDQEAYWDFYLGYNTGTLPGQGQPGNPPMPSGNYNNGDYADLYFVVSIPPDALGNVSLSSVLSSSQIPNVTQASYFSAYQGHYNNFFYQWVQNTYAVAILSGATFPWLHWVDIPASTANDPTTWYTLTPTVLNGAVTFQAQTSQFPINNFGGKCPTADCFPSGIWWAINWPSGFQCSSKLPCITMTNLNAAWNDPRSPGTVLANAGITVMTNAEFFYGNNSATGAIYSWGYQAANHPAEQVYYYGWGTLGTLYVPRTVLYTTFAPPLPSDCSNTTPPEGLHFDGSGQTINGFVMVPYGTVTFNGSGANNFKGEIFTAQLTFSGSGVTLTYDSKSAVKGDPGLIQ